MPALRALVFIMIVVGMPAGQVFAGAKVELTDHDMDEVSAAGIVKQTTVHFLPADLVFLAATKIKSFSVYANLADKVTVNGSPVPINSANGNSQPTVPIALKTQTLSVGYQHGIALPLIWSSKSKTLNLTTTPPFFAFFNSKP